jgi:hypothetical protein
VNLSKNNLHILGRGVSEPPTGQDFEKVINI